MKYFQFQPIFKNMNKISAHQFFVFKMGRYWIYLLRFSHLYLPNSYISTLCQDYLTRHIYSQLICTASFHTELKDIQSRTKTTQSQYYAFKWHTTMTLPPYFDINTKDTLKRPPDIKDPSICHVKPSIFFCQIHRRLFKFWANKF